MTTQTTQTELFPKTTMEVLESLRAFHVADVEKAGTALENLDDDEKIARRYEKAEERLAAARGLVSDIDRAIHELGKMDRGKSVMQAAADIVNSGALDSGGITVTASVTPAVDPITGEVAPATVSAVYPGDDEPHETQVGDRTRYSELVADYLTAVGLHDVVDADEWTVVARRELTQDGGGYRSLHDVIAPEDYGAELAVVSLSKVAAS